MGIDLSYSYGSAAREMRSSYALLAAKRARALGIVRAAAA